MIKVIMWLADMHIIKTAVIVWYVKHVCELR